MISKSRKFRKKGFYRKIIFNIFCVLFVLGLIVFFIVSNIRISRRKKELNTQIKSLKEEIQALEKKNQELKAGISQTLDEAYLEEVAREKFLLKKEGEEVVVVSSPEEIEEKKVEEQKSLWQRFLEKLKF